MNKVRYIYKEYLAEYDLDIRLFDTWGLKVDDLYPLRKVFIVNSQEKKYILKRVNYSKEFDEFLNTSLEYIRKKFDKILENEKTISGNYISEYAGKSYVLINLIEGRECSVESPIDLKLATKGIAMLHKASVGLKDIVPRYNKYEDVKTIFSANIDELEKLKLKVLNYEYKDNFDDKFIEHVDGYIDELKACDTMIKDVDLEKINNNIESIVLCHNDLAYHNILIKNQEAYFIDFDYCNINYRVKDLAEFIIKSIKNVDYDEEMYKIILQEYENTSVLMEEEKKLLKVFFRYPKEIVELILNYYYKRKNWTKEEFISIMDMKIEHEKQKIEFLQYKL